MQVPAVNQRYLIFERIGIFLGIYAYFLAGYTGVDWLTRSRPARLLVWDPIWITPVRPAFLVVYLSAFVLPVLALFLVTDRGLFRRLAGLFVSVITISFVCFTLLPLRSPQAVLAGQDFFSAALARYYQIDHFQNLFPSLHVSMALLFALAVGKVKPRWRVWLLGWAAAVAISTLYVHQHYYVDVIGGVVLALAGWAVFEKLEAQRPAAEVYAHA